MADFTNDPPFLPKVFPAHKRRPEPGPKSLRGRPPHFAILLLQAVR